MKLRTKKILVFGYFGYVTNQLDGQTIKTREIYELIKSHDEYDVCYADTQEFRENFKSVFIFSGSLHLAIHWYGCLHIIILSSLLSYYIYFQFYVILISLQ